MQRKQNKQKKEKEKEKEKQIYQLFFLASSIIIIILVAYIFMSNSENIQEENKSKTSKKKKRNIEDDQIEYIKDKLKFQYGDDILTKLHNPKNYPTKEEDFSDFIKKYYSAVDNSDQTFQKNKGLYNGGNWCFSNSLLQAMFHCSTLREKIKQKKDNYKHINYITNVFDYLDNDSSTNYPHKEYEIQFNQYKKYLNEKRLDISNQQDAAELFMKLFTIKNIIDPSLQLSSKLYVTFNGDIKFKEKLDDDFIRIIKYDNNKWEDIDHIHKHYTDEFIDIDETEYTKVDSPGDDVVPSPNDNQVKPLRIEEYISISDYYIIQLSVFSFDETVKKILHKPYINKDIKYDKKKKYATLQLDGNSFKLSSIIIHTGSTLHSGHYYCVTHDKIYNDRHVSNDEKIYENIVKDGTINDDKYAVPYLYFFEKIINEN